MSCGTDKRHFTIVKVGGAVVEDPESLNALLDSFAGLRGSRILVHGGGRAATRIASEMGLESVMVDGRRVTDGAMLRVVTMVYGGLVNKQIVASLQSRGVNAVGLTGADLGVVRSHRRGVTPSGIDYGFVGDVDSVDAQALISLADAGAVAVMAPLTLDTSAARLLNTNADTIAASVATALAAAGCDVELTYCFEMPGVMADPADPTTVIGRLCPALYSLLRADGTVGGGMLPKLDNAFGAIEAGVAKVRITRFNALDRGTVLTAD